MTQLTLTGFSDDTVEYTLEDPADTIVDELYDPSGSLMLRVEAPDGQALRVWAAYQDDVWGFMILQVEEDVPLPNWKVRVDQSPDSLYSTRMTLHVPDGTAIWLT